MKKSKPREVEKFKDTQLKNKMAGPGYKPSGLTPDAMLFPCVPQAPCQMSWQACRLTPICGPEYSKEREHVSVAFISRAQNVLVRS